MNPWSYTAVHILIRFLVGAMLAMVMPMLLNRNCPEMIGAVRRLPDLVSAGQAPDCEILEAARN